MRLPREFTIAVPQEVSLLSLEDSPLASLLYPPLTCISWPLEALLDNCIQRIRSLIDDRPTFTAEGPLAGWPPDPAPVGRRYLLIFARLAPGQTYLPFRAFVSGLIITHACK